MPLKLYLSNDLEVLARQFKGVLDAHWQDPFSPPAVVVPDQCIGKWLKLCLAQSDGISANIQLRYLEEFLWESLGVPAGVEMLRGDMLLQLILSRMTPAYLQGDDFSAVRNYLDPNATGSYNPVKVMGLCSRLSNLFLEYEYNRSSIRGPGGEVFRGIESLWPGEDFFTHMVSAEKKEKVQEMERWQRSLYGLIFGVGGALEVYQETTGVKYYSLVRMRALSKNNPQGKELSPVLLFGIGQMSRFHRNRSIEISHYRDVNVFQLNPCSAFWEDVETSRSRGTRTKWQYQRGEGKPVGLSVLGADDYQCEDVAELKSFVPEDNRLLELWGHTGKEMITLWCQAADYDFECELREPEEATVLGTVQGLVLTREAELSHRLEQDDSLRICEAPDMLREVEMLRDMLLDELEEARQKGNPLCLRDITVYLPDPSLYDASFKQVFTSFPSWHEEYIPCTLAEGSTGTSRFSSAVESLVNLIRGHFSRLKSLIF